MNLKVRVLDMIITSYRNTYANLNMYLQNKISDSKRLDLKKIKPSYKTISATEKRKNEYTKGYI